FFFSSRRRHTRLQGDWSSDVCSSDLWIGCGADANPLPRGKVELCEKYGRELADAVEDVVMTPMTPIRGTCAAGYARVSLPFDRRSEERRVGKECRSGCVLEI